MAYREDPLLAGLVIAVLLFLCLSTVLFIPEFLIAHFALGDEWLFSHRMLLWLLGSPLAALAAWDYLRAR